MQARPNAQGAAALALLVDSDQISTLTPEMLQNEKKVHNGQIDDEANGIDLL